MCREDPGPTTGIPEAMRRRGGEQRDSGAAGQRAATFPPRGLRAGAGRRARAFRPCSRASAPRTSCVFAGLCTPGARGRKGTVRPGSSSSESRAEASRELPCRPEDTVAWRSSGVGIHRLWGLHTLGSILLPKKDTTSGDVS